MKEKKEKKHSQKRSKGVVNPFSDDKLQQRLIKSVERVKEIRDRLENGSQGREDEEFKTDLCEHIKEIKGMVDNMLEDRKRLDRLRKEIKKSLESDADEGIDDTYDNEDDESCFYDTGYIMLKPKDLRNLLKYAGDRAIFLSMVKLMSYLDAITHTFLDRFKDFEKTSFYKRNEGVINTLFNDSFTEEDG